MITDSTKLFEALRSYTRFGFQVSRKTWDWLDLPELVEAPPVPSGPVEIRQLRLLADRVNERQYAHDPTAIPVHGGDLVSVGFIVDVFRYIVEVYCQEQQPGTVGRGLEATGRRMGEETISRPPSSFVSLFPPLPVLKRLKTDAEYLREARQASLAHDRIVREIILEYLSTANPAFGPFRALFDDTELKNASPYVPLIDGLQQYFATQPPFAPLGMTLFESLFAPIRECPASLRDQVDYIRTRWGHFLPADLLARAKLAMDILEEERRLRGAGPGRYDPRHFDRGMHRRLLGYSEVAAFSEDADWMSNVVLIAKSVYVWLYQLSRQYGRDIRRLNDIPDEELDRLASWGITGLWLIGLWERSSASSRIKQIMGNPEAAASAYSLYDYVSAHDLGGEEAFQQLKQRAWRRGIRLASDMVPNHMGIYSKWVIEHPQWFLQSDYPPFPVYRYTGVDLSEDPRVCIQIEDGYWQHRDAAVVFKRIDKWTGDAKYIYHGNDGTSMPWNDTAQLNFLMPEVREAVIQMILHVARQFPIIRFDAAMTLAKRHYQRLWFPQPGDGGAIPSRAEQGMTREDFDRVMPKEFWREVVDRVAQEVPNTLLLAEAFWLMEGYFVRTLGMHRVYNSAFMNMLHTEDNANYRMTIKNVLEFSPEVLKRFVNFMNNPDERTAVEQFGRGDKYYGVAVMMVTMPGLPMLGHGQIEGFSEKYGMEYRRSYWDEQVDYDMVRRHEAEVFPLMRRRYLFSGAANFALYDFATPEGWVDENVFAYSNRVGGECALIMYNNSYHSTRGTIHTSTAINTAVAPDTSFVRRSLVEALGLDTAGNVFYAFRDYQSGLEYLRSARQLAEQGFYAELRGYQYHAFLDFRLLCDFDGGWAEVERRLGGQGVPSLDEVYRELKAEPFLGPYRKIMNADTLRELLSDGKEVRDRFCDGAAEFYESAGRTAGVRPEGDQVARLKTRLEVLDVLLESGKAAVKSRGKADTNAAWEKQAAHGLKHVAVAWLSLEALIGADAAGTEGNTPPATLAVTRIDKWLLLKAVREAFAGWLSDGDLAYWDAGLVRILILHPEVLVPPSGRSLGESLSQALADPSVGEYLQVNRYQDILWLSRERLERLTAALWLVTRLATAAKKTPSRGPVIKARQNAKRLLSVAESAGYRVESVIRELNRPAPVRKTRRKLSS